MNYWLCDRGGGEFKNLQSSFRFDDFIPARHFITELKNLLRKQKILLDF